MTKKPSVSALHKKVWSEMSKYIRLKNSINGWCTCITCGVNKPWKEMQAGHYMSRRFKNTIYEEMNVHPQCFADNIMLHGNLVVYRRIMDDLYGPKAVLDLEMRARKIRKWTTWELEELLEDFKAKNNTLTPLK